MKFKNLIKIFCVGVGVVFAVACSDDEDEPSTGSGTTAVTSQLSAPRNITYTSTQTSINFSWGSVSGATGYEVSLAKEGSTGNATTVEVTSTSYNFTDLEGGTSYIFAVRALYSPNPEFNSEFTEIAAETLGYTKLATPLNLAASEISKTSATITWNSVSGAANYRVILTNKDESKEVDNQVQANNVYYADNLTAQATYIVSVQALTGDGSTESEWDSDVATLEFVATESSLTAPKLTTPHISHALVIMEWEYTNSMLVEQDLSDDTDEFNFRLCNENGEVLREVDNYNAFNFKRYPSYRLAWGGLTASTTYIMQAQRVSSSELYTDSDWASVKVTTAAEPDTSDYLLWWDFDNVSFGANAIYAAYGFSRKAPKDDDWTNPENITYGVPSDTNTIYSQNMSGFDQSFYDTFVPGILADEVLPSADNQEYIENTTHNATVEAGHAKFGGSSRNAWITLPAVEVSENSTICLELDTCPFTQPKTGTGGWWKVNNDDVVEYFYVKVPNGKIVSVEGETSASAVIDSADEGLVRLKNVLVDDSSFITGEQDPYRYTSHKIKISGVGPDTRILIYTALEYDGFDHRMWMDNVKISKAD